MGKAENIQKYYKTRHYKQKLAERLRLTRFDSLEQRIWENLVSRINQEIPKANRGLTIKELIGCDAAFLLKHLTEQYTEGMTNDNYPDWEPDHVLPVASFDLRKPDQQKACFHYQNMKPLWQRDNRSKGKRTE